MRNAVMSAILVNDMKKPVTFQMTDGRSQYIQMFSEKKVQHG